MNNKIGDELFDKCATLAERMSDAFVDVSPFEAVVATLMVLKGWRQNYPQDVAIVEELMADLKMECEIVQRREDA